MMKGPKPIFTNTNRITAGLTQKLMADLFQTTKQNVGQHLKNIFSEGELLEDSVVKKSFTTATDEKTDVNRIQLLSFSRNKSTRKVNPCRKRKNDWIDLPI